MPLVDVALPVELFAEAWPYVQTRLGLPDLRIINASKHKPYQAYYTKTLRELTAQYYAEDLEHLRHGFDGPLYKQGFRTWQNAGD